jgi:hypothetical protein
MKTSFLVMILLSATLAMAQAPHKQVKTEHADTDAILITELPNLRSDLAELRSMLNVLASQESAADLRTSAALQTNRKMWQVVIARLAELTQRLDALEKQRAGLSLDPK